MAQRRANRVKTEYGPQALYSYAIVDALLDIKEADRRSFLDGGLTFHKAVNHFLTLAAPEIGYYTRAWREWQERTFDVAPGGSLMIADRRVEIAMAVQILRRRGILGWKDKPFSDDAEDIAELLESDLDAVEETLLDMDG